MTVPVIETEALSKQYRVGSQTIDALSDLTVRIDPGEFVAIMGPSGSGKSTCMHLFGCLQTPSSGHYEFNGNDVSAMNETALAETRNSMVGFVFQSFHLLARSTSLRNVELPLIYSGAKNRYRREMAIEALNSVGLGDRAQHRPDQLSGGQMQRVAIARALVNKPRLLLADEPTGALDSQTSVEIMELFKALNEKGITIVVVTHNEEVARQASRILRFRDGKMIADEVHP